MFVPLRWALALAAPLLLTSCLLTPGQFVSTLDIRADRSFTFTYVGEVVVIDPVTVFSQGIRKARRTPTAAATMRMRSPPSRSGRRS